MHRVDEAAPRHRQPEAVAEQRRDRAIGQAVAFIEQHRKCDGVWPEVNRRRSQRVRGLQRVAPLQAATTVTAPTNLDAEGPHEGPLHRQLFLILEADALGPDRAGTVGTTVGERRLVGRVDPRRDAAEGAHPVRRAGFAPGASRLRHPPAAREGCRLAIDRASRGVELLFQFFVFTPQPLPLRLDRRKSSRKRSISRRCSSMICCGSVGGGSLPRAGTCLLPDSFGEYKREMRVSTH
jgi:hypothetical protein